MEYCLQQDADRIALRSAGALTAVVGVIAPPPPFRLPILVLPVATASTSHVGWTADRLAYRALRLMDATPPATG